MTPSLRVLMSALSVNPNPYICRYYLRVIEAWPSQCMRHDRAFGLVRYLHSRVFQRSANCLTTHCDLTIPVCARIITPCLRGH